MKNHLYLSLCIHLKTQSCPVFVTKKIQHFVCSTFSYPHPHSIYKTLLSLCNLLHSVYNSILFSLYMMETSLLLPNLMDVLNIFRSNYLKSKWKKCNESIHWQYRITDILNRFYTNIQTSILFPEEFQSIQVSQVDLIMEYAIDSYSIICSIHYGKTLFTNRKQPFQSHRCSISYCWLYLTTVYTWFIFDSSSLELSRCGRHRG